MWRVVHCNIYNRDGVKTGSKFKIYDRNKKLVYTGFLNSFDTKEEAQRYIDDNNLNHRSSSGEK